MKQAHSEKRRRILTQMAGAGITSMLGLAPTFSRAQSAYPNRALRFVVPFSPGSGTDNWARVYATALTEVTGQPVVVENKAGGNGIIGVNTVLGSPPDGYTVLFAANSVFATNVATVPNLPYDPLRDLQPITTLDRAFCSLIVPAKSPYRTLEDLLEDARRRPGVLNNAAGSPTYALWSDWFNDIAKIDTVNILYKGSGEAMNAVVAGVVDYAIISTALTIPLASGGQVRALLYSGKSRYPDLPSVPTSAEAGLPEFEAMTWSAVAVREGTPEPIVGELERIFSAAEKLPLVQSNAAKFGYQSIQSGSEGMRRFQVEEIERWQQLVKAAGLKLQ